MGVETAEITRLRSLAVAGASSLRTGTQWETLLRRVERSAEFGLINTLLIWAQRPDAVQLRDYRSWRAAGRQVLREERGIRVIVPDRGRRKAGHTADERIGSLFDLLQTEGRPVPIRPPGLSVPAEAAALTPDVWGAVAALGLREGVHLPGADGDGAELAASIREIATRMCGGWTRNAVTVGPWTRSVMRDSVAFLITLRLGLDTTGFSFPSVSSWAGIDERARRTETILTAGELLVSSACRAFRCLDANMQHRAKLVTGPRLAARDSPEPAQPGRPAPPAIVVDHEVAAIQEAAALFFTRKLERSWVPEYLSRRAFGPDVLKRWRIGYAPGSWTALTAHLRTEGYAAAAIEAAGLGRRSARGDLVDVFRDRLMFPIRLPDGAIAGFIGRAPDDAGPGVPKYLNSKQTSMYRKGLVLYGLHEGKDAWVAGARPIVVEGPLDAIAVTEAGHGRYAGAAPCGTVLTGEQVRSLAEVASIPEAGVVVAFDGDSAGYRAALRAYGLLSEYTDVLAAVAFPAGEDPASVLSQQGPEVLCGMFDEAGPLADVVIDATVAKFGDWLTFIEGKFNALAAVAPLVAQLPQNQVARQVGRVANLLGLTHTEVTTAVAEAVSKLADPEKPRRITSSPAASAVRQAEPRLATAPRRRAG